MFSLEENLRFYLVPLLDPLLNIAGILAWNQPKVLQSLF